MVLALCRHEDGQCHVLPILLTVTKDAFVRRPIFSTSSASSFLLVYQKTQNSLDDSHLDELQQLGFVL